MNVVFVDTSGIYAAMDGDDANHGKAKAVWAPLVRDATLLTHNYVLVETSALIQHRLGLGALRAFHADVVPLLVVEWVTREQHWAAMEAVFAASRKRLSLVDCLSFQTMRERGVRRVFGFGSHFREQGFQTIPH